MRVSFVSRDNGPQNLLCEAEIAFEKKEGLDGLKLVGFSLWKGTDGDIYVTFPSRAFGAGSERRYFDYLRSADGKAEAVKTFKQFILGEYKRRAV